MKTVFLVMHQSKSNLYELTLQVAQALLHNKIAIRTEPWLKQYMGSLSTSLFSSDETAPIDAIISVGGDGTLLRANQISILHGAPLLGINVGHLGFLAEVELEQLGTAFEKFNKAA